MDQAPHFRREDVGLLLIRVMVASVLLFHGSQKLFGLFDGPGLAGFAGWLDSLGYPLPTLSAYLATAVEVLGGLALLFGVQVRRVAVPMAITMLLAAITAHTGFNFTQGGMEYPLILMTVLIGFALMGGGRITMLNLLPPRAPIVSMS